MEPQNTTPAATIITLTSKEKEEKIAEIQKRLQSEDARKARKLLTIAFSEFEAMKVVRGQIEKQVLNGKYVIGSSIFTK